VGADASPHRAIFHRLDQIKGLHMVPVLLEEGGHQDIGIKMGIHRPANWRI